MASSSRYHLEGSGCTTSSTHHCNINILEAKSKAPLGLQWVKTEGLLSLLEMEAAKLMGGRKTSRDNDDIVNLGSQSQSQSHQYQPMSEKLKASNFPISFIRIGEWKRESRKEGELTAKLYFAKRKLVWEFLDGQLKSKMEVAWSDIIALKATMLPNQHGVLQIELANPPLFFKELTPQPRKHTNWQQTPDFTNGQAPIYRIHYATFPPGALDHHYEKLLQCDQNLYELSKRPFPSHQSPFFNSNLPLLINIISTTSGLEHQQRQQQSRFHHQYPTPSMASHSTSLNPIITQGYNVRDRGAMHNLSRMDERNSEARGAVWGNQTTFVDSSLIDRRLQQQQQWEYDCEYGGSSLEYPPPPPPPPFNYQNVNNIDDPNIINPAAGNMYNLQSDGGVYDYGYGYGYGYGGRGLSAADEEELLKIIGDEQYKWLIPHILGRVEPNPNPNSNSNSNSNSSSGIIEDQILYPYPSDPTSLTNTNHVQHPPPQGFADMHPNYL